MQAEQQSERERFEAWISEDGKWSKAAQRSGDGYMLAYAQSAWTAWQAGWQARAALSHPSTPQGWKLVPVEPTEKMQGPSYMGPDGPKWPTRKSIYRAMIAACPPTPAKPEAGGPTDADWADFGAWTERDKGAMDMLGKLIDVWDDGQLPHEHRCYVEGAWAELIAEARAMIAPPPPEQGGRNADQA